MLGRLLLTLDAMALVLGAPIADYNHTTSSIRAGRHMQKNKMHHRFHGAQTITLSRPSLLPPSTPSAIAKQRARDSLHAAVFTGTVYWLAGLASILFPGTDGIDPEFGPSGFPQAPAFTVFASLAVLGWLLERRA
ncbi:hypothetical protein N658DRAFT_489484 [Parathielavia hyrcaniae]|uniref:Uncharacterized protein n=1 Tax=Parathielavia hyrcaniae TaxID=113614 RepID=A0AAN6PSB8_9PEZI|nr:hypothetical protein N658DRAFT_489484 [Parathielavia hyrcaniae]